MRHRASQFLCRLADFIEPKGKQASALSELTIRIEADTSQAMTAFAELEARILALVELSEKVKLGS